MSRTAIWLSLLGVAVTAVALAAAERELSAGRAEDPPGRPRLVVATSQVDAGTLRPYVEASVSLPVRNEGDSRLVLVAAGGCCGGLDEQILVAPGAEAAIPIAVQAPPTPGEFQRNYAFSTNDPAQPVLQVSVSARVSE